MKAPSGTQARSEARLVARLRAGDPDAFETLMARHAATVRRVAYRVVRNAADAEDVTQDVFLTVLRRIGAFRGRSALATWLYRITTNAALGVHRRRRRWGEGAGERAGLDETAALPAATARSETEARGILEGALRRLPRPWQAVLVLRDLHGYSTEEVADAVGASVPAVKARLHRARASLRQDLRPAG